MADAEATVEAASRPTMRFVAVRTDEQPGAAIAYHTRDLLARQRTQTINALRAHLAEQGIVAPAGPAHVGRLVAVIDGNDGAPPETVRDLARLLLTQISSLSEKIAGPDLDLRRRASGGDTARRLGRGTDHGGGDHHLRAIDGDILGRASSRGLGRPHAETALERRQRAARRWASATSEGC